MGRYAAATLMAVAGLSVAAQPAEARRFRLFGVPSFGRSETIDPVYDLPNRAPYERDGDYFDLGYLNALSRANDGYVLYHGSRYIKLDPSDLSTLTAVLGFDPAANYRNAHAAEAKAARAPFEAKLAAGEAIERRAGESNEDYTRRRAIFAAKARARQASEAAPASDKSPPVAFGGIGTLILLLAIGAFAWRMVKRGSRSRKPDFEDDGDTARGAAASSDLNHLSFDERVAHRLAEIRASDRPVAAPASALMPSALPTFAPPTGFGRKTA